MNILFVSRKFPPSIGGMQIQSFQLYKALARENNVILISWGYSQVWLPFFIIYALLLSFGYFCFQRIEVVQLGDMVLSPLGFLLKKIFRKPTFTICHGKDSAYRSWIYNFFVIGAALRLDTIICVSNNMRERLIGRGIPSKKLVVIPNGICVADFVRGEKRHQSSIEKLKRILKTELEGNKVILCMARLVKKKGVLEFIRDIYPLILNIVEKTVLLIAGDGPQREDIVVTIKRVGLEGKVFLLGYVRHNSDIYRALFDIADVFVMPNRTVESDAEGFGIVALEAAIQGVPVVAFRVDGISDAVFDGESGILVDEDDNLSFAREVVDFLLDRKRQKEQMERAYKYVVNAFDWDKVIRYYLQTYKMHMRN